MKKTKRNTIITIIIIALILLGAGTFFIINYSPKETGLSILEKKWITDHTNKVVDVDVYNDIPIYGYNGSGIIFDFLNYVTEQYQIQFNKVSYYADSTVEKNGISFLILNDNEQVGEQDILLEEDAYVVVSAKDQDNITLEEIDNIGILKSDSAIAKAYFKTDIQITQYEDMETLVAGLKNEECSYVLIPNISYMAEILTNDFHIVYHVEDLRKKFVLRAEDATVYTILKKSYSEYLEQNYNEDYSKNYLDVYFKSKNVSDLNRKNYNAKTYRYGYVINMPYENYVNNQFVGTISNYLSTFEIIADVEIETILYSSIDDLKSALVSGEVDFALGNFEYEKLNMNSTTTRTITDLNYVVLSKEEYQLNSLKGLTDQEVSVVAGSRLYNLATDSGLKTKNYPNTDELLRNISDQSIVLMDQETYLYYQDNKVKDYKIILEDTLTNEYKFILNQSNETFNDLFNYYVSTMDYNNIRYQYHTDITLDKDYTMIKVIAFIIALIFFLIATVILMNRKNVTNTVISKEEILKYIDPMTSLKNRNYLNMNIYKWDDNVIFPQSVVILDVCRLKEVNDTYGRETGDEIIKKAASILINNQLENTDIIRSDGDEFLIYMVGYEEKQVSEYTKKILREMKNIPNCLGIEVGYSMILDEVKTVDDAINEAITMMQKNKEKKKIKDKEG